MYIYIYKVCMMHDAFCIMYHVRCITYYVFFIESIIAEKKQNITVNYMCLHIYFM